VEVLDAARHPQIAAMPRHATASHRRLMDPTLSRMQ